MNDFEEQDYKKGFDPGLWRKILSFTGRYKKEMSWLLFCILLDAVINSIFPQLSRYAINTFIPGANGNSETVQELGVAPFIFGAVFIITIVVKAVGIYLYVENAGGIETGIVRDVREKGFKKLQSLTFSYYDKTPVGWIMARMTSDTGKIGETIAWALLDVIYNILFIIIVFIFMLLTNVKLALITISIMPVMLAISVYFQRRILKGHREARKINSKITAAYAEGISGAKTTKTLIREEKNFEEFQELTGNMRNANVRISKLYSVYFPLMFIVSSLGIGLVIWIGGGDFKDVLNKHNISLGDLTAFIAYASSFFDPINQLANILGEMQSAQASGERTMTLIETEADIKDSDELIEKYGDWENPKPQNWDEITGNIEFKDVSFKYKNGEKVLKNFNLKVKAGEKIALVGETGSGKSTIVNLICRFYEPTEGQVLIDGVDYRERTQIWLQSGLGYVLQSPHLFSGSVKENIRYGNLDATDEEIKKAAETVNALSFISKLEYGFDTDVGEGGNRLSSGEKQLVSFARAIIGDPRIFVLDEATSSIDAETEQTIQNAIYTALEGRTSFIIAHRLSTIRSCDRILVIRDGEVIENGNHVELLAQHGYYYNLYTNQFKEEAESRVLNS